MPKRGWSGPLFPVCSGCHGSWVTDKPRGAGLDEVTEGKKPKASFFPLHTFSLFFPRQVNLAWGRMNIIKLREALCDCWRLPINQMFNYRTHDKEQWRVLPPPEETPSSQESFSLSRSHREENWHHIRIPLYYHTLFTSTTETHQRQVLNKHLQVKSRVVLWPVYNNWKRETFWTKCMLGGALQDTSMLCSDYASWPVREHAFDIYSHMSIDYVTAAICFPWGISLLTMILAKSKEMWF